MRARRAADVGSEVGRQLQLAIIALRRGLGVDDSFENAIASLRRQLIARGGDGVLRDVVCHLSEDGKTAMLAAPWASDDPATAIFILPAETTEEDFDSEFYVRQCER